MDDAQAQAHRAVQARAHQLAAKVLANYLKRTDPVARLDLVVGFSHAAAAALAVIEGPRSAAEHFYATADHLATSMQ